MISLDCARSPLVSIILPVYGRRQFLGPSIRSVLEQSYRNNELIVVDDGSSESLEESVQCFAPGARYIRQAHAGVAAARNRGLKETRGELIAFQDSDDVWHPRKLSTQVAFLNSNPDVGVVYTAKRAIDEAGRVVGGQWKQLHSGYVTEPLFREVFVIMPSVVMRRSVAESVGAFDTSLKINSDYQYWLRASLLTKFAAIDAPLIDVRRSTRRLTLARAEAAVLRYRMLMDFYESCRHRDWIRPPVARGVLAKAAFHAARALRKEGRPDDAEQWLRASLALRFTPRAAWSWLCARCRRGIMRDRHVRPHDPLSPERCLPLILRSDKQDSSEMRKPARRIA